jgi:acyl carrier protein
MNEPAEIQEQLLAFLRGGMFSPEITITADTDLVAHGFDSLSLMSLLLFVEKTYALWIPENEITEATLQNVRTLTALIVRLLHERQPLS